MANVRDLRTRIRSVRSTQQITRASIYVFFTTDRIADPDTDNNSMGRSVLARSEDGGIYFGTPLYDMSRGKLVQGRTLF